MKIKQVNIGRKTGIIFFDNGTETKVTKDFAELVVSKNNLKIANSNMSGIIYTPTGEME